ncbi:mitochondrial carrier protein, partial [Lactarius psammicola]
MSHLAPSGKWDARHLGPVPHDTSYYAKCMLGGGMFKYGLYEIFKDAYMNLAGQEASEKYKGCHFGSPARPALSSSPTFALCPLEMTKVKIQTSPAGTFPVPFGAAWAEMARTSAEPRFPFGSLVPLWSRQIPYTMAKFFCFEKIVQVFYTRVFTEPKDSYGKPTQLGITFASGYLSGVVCAVVSHPADSLPQNKGKSLGAIVNEVGFGTLATKGLGTRVVMIGTLTGFQWWIYDTFKSSMGMGTDWRQLTGGH